MRTAHPVPHTKCFKRKLDNTRNASRLLRR
jgi:hypothetical protein